MRCSVQYGPGGRQAITVVAFLSLRYEGLTDLRERLPISVTERDPEEIEEGGKQSDGFKVEAGHLKGCLITVLLHIANFTFDFSLRSLNKLQYVVIYKVKPTITQPASFRRRRNK